MTRHTNLMPPLQRCFARQVTERLDSQGTDEALVSFWRNCGVANLDDLSIEITRFTKQCPKPVILTIDEVDKSSDNQLFLNFLGMLRNMYLQRNKSGMDSTFYSVILAGVYDIKNLKLRIRPDAEKKYNSPWNIAADFNVDMTFHHEEKGRDQLSSFLATRGMDEGYLVTFDFSKDRQDTEPQWIDWNGKRLFEVII